MTPRQTPVRHVGQVSDADRATVAVRVAVATFHQRIERVLGVARSSR